MKSSDIELRKIVLRPSSLNQAVACPRQWFLTYFSRKPPPRRQNARSAIGSGVHAGVEMMWKEAMETQEVKPNVSAMVDAGVEKFQFLVKESELPVDYDTLDYDQSCELIKGGAKAYATDIAPFVDIPKKVEVYYIKELKNDYISALAGTVDYVSQSETGGALADLKTSKRKIAYIGHVLQQSAYWFLLEDNGVKIDTALLHGVVFSSKGVEGSVVDLQPNIPQLKVVVNSLLRRLTLVSEQKIDPELLFPGNPRHYLCSDKYCDFRATCPFVNGEIT